MGGKSISYLILWPGLPICVQGETEETKKILGNPLGSTQKSKLDVVGLACVDRSEMAVKTLGLHHYSEILVSFPQILDLFLTFCPQSLLPLCPVTKLFSKRHS